MSKYTLHVVHDICLGTGWRFMDKAYCGATIETYQYRPEQEHGDLTPQNLQHYSRCALCTARLWNERQLEIYARGWHRG